MLEAASLSKIYKHPHLGKLAETLKAGTKNFFLKGLLGSAPAVFANRFYEQDKNT